MAVAGEAHQDVGCFVRNGRETPRAYADVHLWSHDTARYPAVGWKLNGESRLPQVNGEADGLVERMGASGVSYALNVQVPWYVEDFRFANH